MSGVKNRQHLGKGRCIKKNEVGWSYDQRNWLFDFNSGSYRSFLLTKELDLKFCQDAVCNFKYQKTMKLSEIFGNINARFNLHMFQFYNISNKSYTTKSSANYISGQRDFKEGFLLWPWGQLWGKKRLEPVVQINDKLAWFCGFLSSMVT